MTEITHACPPDGSGLMPCCGRTPLEVSRLDRMTSDPEQVTCKPAPTCGEECAEGHVHAGRCALYDPTACVWPDCLTAGQQADLAEEVRRSMHGEPTTAGADQRQMCGCREAAPPVPYCGTLSPQIHIGGEPLARSRCVRPAGHDVCHSDGYGGRWGDARATPDNPAAAVRDGELARLRAGLAAETTLCRERSDLYDQWRTKANQLGRQAAQADAALRSIHVELNKLDALADGDTSAADGIRIAVDRIRPHLPNRTPEPTQ